MAWPIPLPVGGYVLAGGKSSRMGRDKALIELAGKPLVEHAVAKLRRVCNSVNVLSGDPALTRFAPLVADLHPGCGPMSGIEAALAHSEYDWNLILPVDVPFMPAAFLGWWVNSVMSWRGSRLALFRVYEMPQPALLMIHREVAPYLSAALGRGEYKLFSVLQAAAEDIAATRELRVESVLWNLPIDEHFVFSDTRWGSVTAAQHQDKIRWFANLNTPEEFREAELHLDALDT